MSALISKPGLTPASLGLSIPKTWDPVWFKSLVANLLKGADVRNAIAGPGITITGNISTPYATISAGGAGAPFTAPIIIKTTGGTTVFEVFNSTSGPTVEALGPTAGVLVDMTPDFNTFTATLTGYATPPTGTATWYRIGKLVILFLPAILGTSNANTLTMTGLPAAIQPPTLSQFCPCVLQDNTSNVLGAGLINAASGTITFIRGVVSGTAVTMASSGFTASGSKGTNDTVLVYQLT